MIRYWSKAIFLLLAALMVVAAYSIIDIAPVCAHSPHDDITAVAVSPIFNKDHTLFIIIEDRVFKSTDGGFGWKILARGLDNKATLDSVVISPNFEVDQTVFVSSLGDGIYKSQDGGVTWERANTGLADHSIGQVVMSPNYQSDHLILAAGNSGGLYKSHDGGETWYQVLDETLHITALAISPDRASNFAVLAGTEGNLWTSQDSGEHWQRGQQLSGSGAITTIAISDSFSDDGIFFVGTEKQGILETHDGGAGLTPLKRGPSTLSLARRGKRIRVSLAEKSITSLALSPSFARTQTLLATTWYDAVFKSDNSGKSWRKYNHGVTCDNQANTSAYFSAHFRSLGVSGAFDVDRTVFLAGFDGLFKSTDGGEHWLQLETRPLNIIQGLDVSTATDHGFDVAFFTYGGGAYTKHNQEDAWEINNNGLQITRLADIVFSPTYATDQTIFSGVWGALVKSTNGGQIWQHLDLGGSGPNRPYPTNIVLSPEYADDQTLFFATRGHGIMKSTDGGQTYRVLWHGMGRVVYNLVISPDFTNDSTLFASVRGKGVYKSEDAGQTWNPANDGLPFVSTWRSSEALGIPNQDTIIAISPNYAQDKTVLAGSPKADGLYISNNGGMAWHQITGTLFGDDSQIIGLALAPDYKNDQTFIVSVRGKGLFKTEDGGQTFEEIGRALIVANEAIGALSFSPDYATDSTIYAASEENVFQSTNRGETWQLLTRPMRYEDMRGDMVQFEGRWGKAEDAPYSAMTITQSSRKGSTASLHFVGNKVAWLGTVGPDQGMARITIDGRNMGEVDQYSIEPKAQVELFSASELGYGPHTIAVEVSGKKNPAASGNLITIDAFDIE